MSVQVKRRRDTAANVASFTGAAGEIVVDTTNNRIVLQDGVTAGGWPAARLSEVVTNTRTPLNDAAYTALGSDRLIAFTAITAARVVTLCLASVYPTGTRLLIVDESGNCSATKTITVTRAGSDLIDGAASFVLNAAYASLELESNGVGAWTIVSPAPNLISSLVGVGTGPDPANPLSVYGASALFNGANFNFTINKSAAANTASILFQDSFSGRGQIGLNGSDNFSFKVSPNGSAWTTAIALDATTGAPSFANQRTAVVDTAYTALATDRLVAYTAISAARIVTLPSASAFPPGQNLTIVDESGACSASATITVSRSGADTINGATSANLSTAYGFLSLESNGSNRWTVIKRSGNIQVFTTSGTYVPSPGMVKVDVFAIGGGGGGGGGALQAASAAVSGGGGGGGAGVNCGTFGAPTVGASQTVTIAAGGTAGARATTNSTAGGAGVVGGNTTFGSLLTAFGGGAGSGGQLAAASGGGGGGGAYNFGGSASGSTAGSSSLGTGAGSAGVNAANSTTFYGAAGGGGGDASGNAYLGGTSLGGGGGGGSGGGVTAANVANAGANGGNAYQTSTGGAAGAAGSAGSAGATLSVSSHALNLFVSGGGGGGGASLTGAGAGGAGGWPGGGGGGGGSAQNGGTAGVGGAGGAGALIIVEYF